LNTNEIATKAAEWLSKHIGVGVFVSVEEISAFVKKIIESILG